MAKMNYRRTMEKFFEECAQAGKAETNNGGRFVEIDRNKFNGISKKYEEIIEMRDSKMLDGWTDVFTRRSNGYCGFLVKFTDAKRGRPSNSTNRNERINEIWNNILKEIGRT